MRKVELFQTIPLCVDYAKNRCYNAGVAGACTQAFDTSEELPASDVVRGQRNRYGRQLREAVHNGASQLNMNAGRLLPIESGWV